jgi:hypothetical protein
MYLWTDELWALVYPARKMMSFRWLGACAGALCAAVGAGAAMQTPTTVEQVGWLAGCWEHVTPQRRVEEHWMAPRGHTMLSAGRTISGEKLVEYEMVLIREEDGRLAYESHPSGQPSAVFLSRTVGAQEVVFENLQHDFPQRIGYKRDGNALLAWIEGSRNGQTRRVEFPYTRVACPGGDSGAGERARE